MHRQTAFFGHTLGQRSMLLGAKAEASRRERRITEDTACLGGMRNPFDSVQCNRVCNRVGKEL